MPPTDLRISIRDDPGPAAGSGRPGDHAYQRTFAGTADQVREARRFLAGILGGHPAADDAVTCLAEIAANAVQHTHSARPGGTFTVCFRRSGPAIRVEVTDQGGPWKLPPDSDVEHGRGLIIVRELAARRGITVKGPRDNPCERTVWYEMPAPGWLP